jgi:MFS family permease
MGQRRSTLLKPGVFSAIALALFVVTYNLGVLPVIMPSIVRDLNTSVGVVQSVLVLFSLVTASFAPTAANLCRYFGHRAVFLSGSVLYGLGIAATALSPSMGALGASFVVLSGFGAASMVSTPWTVADLVYGGKIDQRVVGALTVTTMIGGSVGALAGGFLASNLGWRWSFVPPLVVLLVVLALGRSLPHLRARIEEPIDWVGGLLSFLGFGSILLGVSLGGELGWWTPRRELSIGGVILAPFAISIVPTLIASGAIVLGFFLFWGRRQARAHRAVLVRAGLLRREVFVRGTLTAMLHTLIVTGVQFNLYQFLPVSLSLNPFRTALIVTPYLVTVAVVNFGSRYMKIGDRFALKYVVVAGLGLLGAGIAMIYSRLPLSMAAVDLVPGLIVMGVGSGLFSSSIGDVAYAAAPEEEKAEGFAVYNAVQSLGSSLGRAILGTLLVLAASRAVVDGIIRHLGQAIPSGERTRLIFQLQEMIQTMPTAEVEAAVIGKLPAGIQPMVYSIERTAATSGIKTALILALILTALCFLLAGTLPKTAPSRFTKKSPASSP